jgi:hypothetical protein
MEPKSSIKCGEFLQTIHDKFKNSTNFGTELSSSGTAAETCTNLLVMKFILLFLFYYVLLNVFLVGISVYNALVRFLPRTITCTYSIYKEAPEDGPLRSETCTADT